MPHQPIAGGSLVHEQYVVNVVQIPLAFLPIYINTPLGHVIRNFSI